MCVYVTSQEKNRLRILATKKGVSQTQIMRDALRLYIECDHSVNPCPACGAKKEKDYE